MIKLIKVMLVVVVLSSIATTVLLITHRSRSQPSALEPDERAKLLSVPEFTLKNQDGTPINRDIFKGKITLIDFIFTHCPFVCSTLTASMSTAAKDLRDTDVRFLSVSVDPVNDTPDRLRAYAKEQGIDLSRWTLATGDQATITAIVKNGMQFDLAEEPNTPINLPDGSRMSNIRHPSWIGIIGPNAEVLGVYPVTIPGETERLIERARAAAKLIRR